MLKNQLSYSKGYFTSWNWVQEDCVSMSDPEEHGPNCGKHRNASSYAFILLISSAIIAHAVVVIKRHSVVIFTESIFIENNLKEKLMKSNNK